MILSTCGIDHCGPNVHTPHMAAATRAPSSGGGILWSRVGMGTEERV